MGTFEAMRDERRFVVIEGMKPLVQAAAQTTRCHFFVGVGACWASNGRIGFPVGTGHIEFSPWRT
jgi:hypothetical protein